LGSVVVTGRNTARRTLQQLSRVTRIVARSARPTLAGIVLATLFCGLVCLYGPRPLVAGADQGLPPAATPINVPTSIPDDCSVDVTNALNSWLASLNGSYTINLPWHACYSVSNSPGASLTFNGLQDSRINGDGAVFKQSSYNNGACDGNTVQPILRFISNSNLTLVNFTVIGPHTCGGSLNEGDYGILLGQAAVGNTDLMFNGVDIENTDGDGLGILPLLGTGEGINSDITFANGRISNIGYHVLTLEGINGLHFRGNTVSGFSNFADLEVDSDCAFTGFTSGCYDGTGTPTGVAQWNVSITKNTFTDATGGGNWIESEQAKCIPQKNLFVENNWLDSSINGTIVLDGSVSSCPTDQNVIIADNVSAGTSRSPCGGSIATPPSCALIEVTNYSGVKISHNTVNAYDGQPGYFANTLFVPCVALGAVSYARVENNMCNDTYPTDIQVGLQFWPPDPSNSNVVSCGNTYGLTNPIADIGSTSPPAPAPVTDDPCDGTTTTTTTTTPPSTPTTTVTTPPPTTTTTTTPSSAGLLLGSYDGAANAGGVVGFANETGTSADIYSDYLDGTSWSSECTGSDFPLPNIKGQLGSKRLILSVPIPGFKLGQNGQSLLASNAANPGHWNACFQTLAQELINDGFSNAIIRLMWEPDSGIYSSGDLTSAQDYATLWRDAWTSAMNVLGAHFQWAWYWGGNFDSTTNSTAWPGNQYVTYVTFDQYDQSWDGTCGLAYNGSNWTATQSECIWNADIAKSLQRLTNFAGLMGKPIGIGEWGVIDRSDGHGGGDDPTFVDNFAAWMNSNNVAWASYFNFNSGGDSILSDYPNSLAAFKVDLGGQ
jgi:hypothetical protein